MQAKAVEDGKNANDGPFNVDDVDTDADDADGG